jgi:hypothetical protein
MALWAVKWRSKNLLDGEREWLILREWQTYTPVLFNTRADCRAWINKQYGYIKTRKDLRTEPHGWRVPQPVRVEVRECR